MLVVCIHFISRYRPTHKQLNPAEIPAVFVFVMHIRAVSKFAVILKVILSSLTGLLVRYRGYIR